MNVIYKTKVVTLCDLLNKKYSSIQSIIFQKMQMLILMKTRKFKKGVEEIVKVIYNDLSNNNKNKENKKIMIKRIKKEEKKNKEIKIL